MCQVQSVWGMETRVCTHRFPIAGASLFPEPLARASKTGGKQYLLPRPKVIVQIGEICLVEDVQALHKGVAPSPRDGSHGMVSVIAVAASNDLNKE